MKKIRVVLIILIVVIAILFVSIFFIFNNNNNNNPNIIPNSFAQSQTNSENGSVVNVELKKNNSRYIYFSIQDAIQNYLSAINKEDIDNVYNVLSLEYINENDITEDNVLNKLQFDNNKDNFTIKELYTITRDDITLTNYVYGTTQSGDNVSEWYGIFDTDIYNYVITPCDKEYYKKIVNNKIDAGRKDIDSAVNFFNMLKIRKISDEEMAKIYYADFKQKQLNNPEEAYMLLDEEYRKANYKSLEDYKKYVEENKGNIEKANLVGFSFEQEDLTKPCIITLLDSNNIYYTLQENAILDYTIKLNK